MHAQPPPALRHGHEGLEHVGLVAGERGELVDHHHEACQGLEPVRRPATDRVKVFVEVDRPAAAQGALPTSQLGIERAHGPSRQGGGEVGERADGVRQRGEPVEPRPPLKSISRNVSASGPALLARATKVRRSSLLPEPVVPATRAWAVNREVDAERPVGPETERDPGARCGVLRVVEVSQPHDAGE